VVNTKAHEQTALNPCIFFNARSIADYITDLEIILEQHKNSIFLICESWLKDKHKLCSLVKYHEIVRYDRTKTRGGGLLIILPKSLKFKEIKNICSLETNLETIGVTIIFNKAKHLDLILSYRKPNSKCSEQMKKVMSYIMNSPNEFIWVGDFNMSSIDWENKRLNEKGPEAEMLLNFVISNGFKQFVYEKTRGNSTLDLVLASSSNFISNLKIQDPFFQSDHKSIFFEISNKNIFKPKNEIEFFCYNKKRLEQVKNDQNIKKFIYHENFELNSIFNIWNDFKDSIQFVTNKFCLVKISKKDVYPKDLLKLQNKLRRSYRKFKENRTPENKNKYLFLKNFWKQKIHEINCSKEKNLLSKNSSEFWKTINKNLSSRINIPILENHKGEQAISDLEKCEFLADQYDTVFQNDNCKPFSDNTKQSVNNLITIQFNSIEVFNKLKKSNKKRSFGLDKIPPLIISTLSLEFSQILKIIFQKSLNHSLIPKEWLQSTISPVPKVKGSSSPADYRPISLTSSVCRTMESIILDKIVEHLDKEGLFSSNQHGFLRKKGTISCMFECLDCWTDSFEKGYSFDILYLDIAKAFDSISHVKLIRRLQHVGIQGLLLKWLTIWLTQRTQAVKIGDTLSSFRKVRSGVPQGSVLGPLLFIIYMSTLDEHLKFCNLKYYADDAKIFMRVKNANDAHIFQNEINNILKWSEEMQLNIAISKCFIMHMNPKKSIAFNYHMNDLNLIKSSVIKDLGILIDDNLSFEDHFTKIIEKAGLMCNILLANFKCRDTFFLKTIFKSFVRPVLEYGNEILHPQYLKDIVRIENVQRSFTRRIPILKNKNYPERLKDLDLESLELRRIKSGLCYIFKILHKLVDVNHHFELKAVRARRSHSQQLIIDILKTRQKQSSLYSLTSIWNALKESTVQAENILQFKKALDAENLKNFCKNKDCFS